MAKRPLLSLRNELRHRQEWRNLVIAMASGPDTFLEGRQILSTWLLASGASCIWELKGELCAIIRDVLEHPSSWDLSEEAGISLPPLSAFYHNRLHSPFIILNQPPSWAGLLELVSFIEKKSSQDASGPKNVDHLDKDLATNYRELALQDSLWMLLMDFPAWLLFASLSLFQRQNIFYEGHINNGVSLSSDSLEYLNSLNHQKIAASYIAWHFSPQDQKLRDLALRMLMQMAQSWLCIKEEKSPGREDTEDVPATKRRKLMDEREMHRDKPKMDEREMDRDKPKAVDGRIAGMERVEARTGGMEALGQTYLSKFATAAVRKWLTKFQDCCCLLDSYSQDGPPHNAETGNKKQAKRRLVIGTGFGDCALGTEQGSQQPETTSSECKSSSFFNTFPLVALLCAPHLHNETVAHLVLHFIMTESQSSSSNVHGGEVSSSDNDAVTYQAAIKGLACREPSHRTEDFRDICRASYCSSFSSYTSASPALGAARVFKFLETLDLLENSDFVNGCRGLGWLDGFKDIIARQLAMCISTWSQKVDSTCLTVLDDLRCRAALWAGRAGLNSRTMRAFNQVLQSLDVLIASSVVEDMLEDV